MKDPKRIAAFGYLVLLAAMVYTPLEQQIRRALQESGEEPVEGLTRKLTREPDQLRDPDSAVSDPGDWPGQARAVGVTPIRCIDQEPAKAAETGQF